MANILKRYYIHLYHFLLRQYGKKIKYKSIFNNNLITSSWPKYKILNKFNKNQTDINNLIELITNIRSTKSELKIAPKLFCDVSFSEKSGKLKKLIKKNFNLIKQTGRINSVFDIKI